MNLAYLIRSTETKGRPHRRRFVYNWTQMTERGDCQIFEASGHSEMDSLQTTLGSAVRYRESKYYGEKYCTRRLPGNRIAIIKVR